MRGGRRIPNRPFAPSNAAMLNNLPSMTDVLRGNPLRSGVSQTEPDPYYDAPDGERRFNAVLSGEAANKLIRKIAGPTVEEAKRKLKPGVKVRITRCNCCKQRPRRKGSLLCGWCNWLLQ